MEAFFRTHAYLIEHTNAPVRRMLMDEIDWNDRMIGIKGTRGIGKTTFLLQYAKENFDVNDRRCLYINMNNFYFQGRGIFDFAGDFYKNGGRVLLIDQVFKEPNWSKQLRDCYDKYDKLKIDSENLLKTMNMVTEVDILFIKQIELKYLTKIKKLFYLLAVNGSKAPNISQLAHDIKTSRATVMNYIKYLADARLINMIYPIDHSFPKKPTKVMMHNSNLIYAIYPIKVETQDDMETLLVNSL